MAGGGGASVFFPKPSWQSGVSGIPKDGARDLPDVSLTAASHDPYLLCLHRACEIVNGEFHIYTVFGTSAAAPSFAGIVALVAPALANPSGQSAVPRLGQVNYVLYALAAAENLSQCNGSNTTTLPASTCVFNDVTRGNNSVPSETGNQYQSGVGYDLASGLGSVNVTNLINAWGAATFHPTTTTLTLNSGNPVAVTHGTAVNLDVGVTSTSGTPSGDIALVAETGYGPSDAAGVTSFTLSGGSASAQTNLLPGGHYGVIAHYEGDGVFAPSDSAPVSVTITPEGSTSRASAFTGDSKGMPIPFTGGPYGTFVYLRADVTSASGSGMPTGSVSFADTAGSIPGSPFHLNSRGNAATPAGVFTLGAGMHSITATYGGDPSFNPSTSPALNFTISQASTTTTATAIANTQGAGAVFTANIVTTSGGNPPSGTVTFSSGSTQLGSVPVIGGVNATNGKAQATVSLTDSQLASGQYSVAATYSGDANYTGSSSTPVALSLQPDFNLSFNTASPSVPAPGGTAQDTLTVTALDGFNGALNFTAASCSGLPAESSCSFSSASVTGSGTTQLTVTTTGPHQSALRGASVSRNFNLWTTSLGLAVAGIFLAGVSSRRRRYCGLFSLLVLASLITLPGCGGGSGGGGGGGVTDPGTPVGTYTVTVTAASGSLTHTASFQLVVQ
jgi:trimeric autotransporter adhesin